MEQLTLELCLDADRDFASFVERGNAEPVAALRAWAAGNGEPYVFVHGDTGTGKSHLLQAACHTLAKARRAVLYLPLARPDLAPAALDDLENLSAVALDDIDAVLEQADWEQALFSLFNRLRASRRRLLVAARRPPAALRARLPDLISRLSVGPCFALRALDDAGLDTLLARGAAQRGFALDQAARRYLLSRVAREPASLVKLLGAIDHASLARGRAPTVPFLSQLLAEQGC